MSCPVCNIQRNIQEMVATEDDLKLIWVPALLYQRSYPSKPEYISPRCSGCYDKVIKKEGKRKVKNEQDTNRIEL